MLRLTRQTEAESLAKDSDAMIVIGGTHSSKFTQVILKYVKIKHKNTFYTDSKDETGISGKSSAVCIKKVFSH